MLALTGACSAEWLCRVAKQAETFSPELQKCKMALRDKMQTSVDIFLAATSSHQESAMIELQGQERWLQLTEKAEISIYLYVYLGQSFMATQLVFGSDLNLAFLSASLIGYNPPPRSRLGLSKSILYPSHAPCHQELVMHG